MRPRLAPLAAALLLAACDGPLPPDSANMDGIWDWMAVSTDSINGTVCSDTGSLRLTQVGVTFAGRSQQVGSCTTPFGTFATARSDSVQAGLTSGNSIAFALRINFAAQDRCTLVGRLLSQPPMITGNGTCGTATVSWSAVVRQPVGAVTVVPDSVGRVVGGSADFSAELRAAGGFRLFFRDIVWSASNAAVAVDQSGVALALAPGQANIVATAEGYSGQADFIVNPLLGLEVASAGNASTCAIAPTGSGGGAALCWGRFRLSPEVVPGGIQFFSLATSRASFLSFTCGIITAGNAYCWGENENGQLGNGSSAPSDSPVPVSGGHSFTRITVGGAHACGVTGPGAMYCWGDNTDGQLGDGTQVASAVPVAVAGGHAFGSISAGDHHTCAVTLGGSTYCWGRNNSGQLGDSTVTPKSQPSLVARGLTFGTVSAGARHTCAVEQPNGTGWCWGSNDAGQLGTNGPAISIAPAQIAGSLSLNSVSAGSIHTCALAGGGVAWCWGVNSWGQLGTGNLTASSVPVAVSGGLAYVSISAGVYHYSDEAHNAGTSAHTCAVAGGGITYCWGDNLAGQLGDGTRVARNVPTKVLGQP